MTKQVELIMKEMKKPNCNSYFNSIASQWDLLREEFYSERVRDFVFELADIKAGKQAADIGAGTGFITAGLLAKSVKVIAVDSSLVMLEVLQSKFTDNNLLEIRLGESEALPLEDKAVDYVFANMYLHHVEHPERAIQEMVRILRPGGILVLTDLNLHDCEFLKTEHHDRWPGFKRVDIINWLKKASLESVTVKDIGECCSASSASGCQKAVISIFAGYGVKVAGSN